MSAGFMPWAIEALVASTVLMLLVLALRKPVRRAFGPEIAYALWLLPALRLLLPPLPHEWRESVAAPVAKASEQFVILVAKPLGGGVAAPVEHASLWGPALILLWVAGAAAFMLWHSVAHARFCRRMLAESLGEALEGRVHVIETSAANGPLAFGIWRRYVAFPRDFAERYDADERDLALAHELGHHARGDLIANWAALAVLALHWFNPVAWRAFRAFRADQEIANDARVLAGRDAVTRHLYACAIVKAAHGGAVSAACHLHTIEDLKGRLKMLTTNRTSRARLAGGTGVVALIAAVGLGTTASGTQAAERVRSKVEKVTGVELSKLTLPAAFQSASAPATTEVTSSTSTITTDGTPGKHHYRVTVTDNGKTVTEHNIGDVPPGAYGRSVQRVVVRGKDGHVISDTLSDGAGPMVPMPPMAPMANMPPMPPQPPMVIRNVRISPNVPQVISANCPGAAISPTVIHDEKNGHRILICTNRIQRIAANAEASVDTKGIERNAYRRALDGLRARRAEIASNSAMNREGRDEALSSIDTAIRELEADLAGVE